MTCGGLTADGFMGAVVQHDVHEVRDVDLADHRHRTHMHDRGAVAVERHDMAGGLFERDPERDRARMSHRSDVQIITRLRFVSRFAQKEQLAGRSAGRRAVDGILRHVIQHDLNSLFTAQGIGIIHIVGFFGIRHHALRRNQPVGTAGLGAVCRRLFDHLREVVVAVREDRIGDMHHIQQRRRDLALQLVLRVIRFAVALSAPADQQQHRNGINILVRQRRQRIDGISHTAVLHIDQRRLLCCKIVSRSDADSVAFVRCDDIFVRTMLQRVVAEAVQIRIRYAGKKRDAVIR